MHERSLIMSVTIQVFDPAMYCSTGVCGPSVDPDLARFAADVDWLQKQGVTVQRHNLSQEPALFASTPAVREALQRGVGVLPILLVDSRVVIEGGYPSREALAALAGVVVRKLQMAPVERACCPPEPAGAEAGSSPTPGSKPGCC
jgi:hypothetical protein